MFCVRGAQFSVAHSCTLYSVRGRGMRKSANKPKKGMFRLNLHALVAPREVPPFRMSKCAGLATHRASFPNKITQLGYKMVPCLS